LKAYSFHEGERPQGFKPDFESFLFNEEKHRLIQSPDAWVSFAILRDDKKKSMAEIHFHLNNGLALSPYRASFGSLEFSDHLEPSELFNFLSQVEQRLITKGATKVRIINPPRAYRANSSDIIEVMLLNMGYHIQQAEIGVFIDVDRTAFHNRIGEWERRRLRQGQRAGLRFREIPIARVSEIYEFILGCRKERGQALSMSLTEITNTVGALADRFFLFGAFKENDLVAASISIRVCSPVLYNFYSAHSKKLDAISPIVTLIAGMYTWSRKNNITSIDLGTSAWEGKPNFGLLDFKLHLGGHPSARLTFEKDLAG
jgi:hypothetical protein